MKMQQSLVKGRLVMSLLVSDELAFDTAVELSYDPGDPLAVRLTFHLPGDPPVTWLFGRELLLDGITRPSGEGDVRVRPVPGTDEDFMDVCIELRSTDGAAVLRSPAVPLISFLGRTDRVLPMGQEHTVADLDRELEAILGR
ncbi:hypothetical protein ABH931_000250 [Streptacidiphilus sp. MAP12-33]|uniref:SsgA family sporulation/cell division regulator n=1 Tax=Streptacidiphilus sp. MAP12-33 TaxID=3156266 RepID=UPI00351468E5